MAFPGFAPAMTEEEFRRRQLLGLLTGMGSTPPFLTPNAPAAPTLKDPFDWAGALSAAGQPILPEFAPATDEAAFRRAQMIAAPPGAPLAPLPPQPRAAAKRAPAPAPKPRPVVTPAQAFAPPPPKKASGPSVFAKFGQTPNETNLNYGVRQALTGIYEAPMRFGNWLMNPISKAAAYAFDTPNAGKARVEKAQAAQAAAAFNPQINTLAQGLIKRGLNPEQAAGIAAGIVAESRGDPRAFNSAGGGNGALGIGQWRGPRQAALKARYGASPTLDQQLDFLVYELRGGDAGGKKVLAAQGTGNILQSYINDFMRPAAGKETVGDLKRGFAALGLPTPPGMEAYDARLKQGFAELDKVQAAAKQPWSQSFALPEAPLLPTPAHYQAPDFSAGNAAFDAAAPKSPFAEPGSETKYLRNNFFRGMAEALLSSGGNTAWGTLLMRAGAGALAGRMAGAEQVQAKMDRYDALMQQYNLAKANRNDTQATALTNTINQNIEMDNRHAYAQAQQNLSEFHKRNNISATEDGVTVMSQGDGGQIQISHTPIAPMVDQKFGQMKAQALINSAGPAQSNAQWAFSTAEVLKQNYAALAMGAGGAAGTGAYADMLANAIAPMVKNGTITHLGGIFGQGDYDRIRQDWDNLPANRPQPGQVNMPLTAAQQQDKEEQWQRYLTTRLVQMGMTDETFGRQMLGRGAGASLNAGTLPVASGAVERVLTQRNTISRGRRGVTSSSSFETVGE